MNRLLMMALLLSGLALAACDDGEEQAQQQEIPNAQGALVTGGTPPLTGLQQAAQQGQ